MKPEDIAWQRLVAASRQVQDDRSTEAPYGFATRVAARALSSDARAAVTLFERWSWRAVAIAGMFAAATLAASYSTPKASLVDDLISDDAAVATLLE